jgi:hypothetical protein
MTSMRVMPAGSASEYRGIRRAANLNKQKLYLSSFFSRILKTASAVIHKWIKRTISFEV